jgi:ADP-heptose:LPS heptosyltransferase
MYTIWRAERITHIEATKSARTITGNQYHCGLSYPHTMPIRLRQVSLLLRRRQSAKDGRRVLGLFGEWKDLQRQLPVPCPFEKKLLLIRLDDIGDYLLFRNQLRMYKRSLRWKDHVITLLGNISWQAIFSEFDASGVDDTMWVDKNEYLASASYRLNLWDVLRRRGFGTVIALSRTRPMLLDDLCMLAAAPLRNLGSANTHIHSPWNRISDSLYQQLFKPSDTAIHEFDFNAQFTAWASERRYEGRRPEFDTWFVPPPLGSYVLCFVGANTRSRRWPVKRWIEFIQLYRQHYSSRVILAGHTPVEVEIARTIRERTGAESIAGTTSILEFLRWVAGAQAVLTNDTMAAHLSASVNRPTVIIANGVNYTRFTEYANAGIDKVETVYPDVFNRIRKHTGAVTYNYPDAVSADIASIKASAVFDKLQTVLRYEEAPLNRAVEN